MTFPLPPLADLWSDLKNWQTLIVGVPASVLALRQLQSIKKTLQTETMFKLMARFDSSLSDERKAATESCLENLASKRPDKRVDELFDLFEDAAFSVRAKSLDENMMWHAFYYWIDLYYQASETYIADQRKQNPTQWSELCGLYPRLRKIEAKRRSALGQRSYTWRMDDSELMDKLNKERSNSQTLPHQTGAGWGIGKCEKQ